jgi:hypothetical protein
MIRLADSSHEEGADRVRAIAISRFQISQNWRRKSRSFNSRTREIANREKEPVDRFERGFQQRIRKSRSSSKGI